MSNDPPKSWRPPVDPHVDLPGALHDVSNALTVLLGWITEARALGATPETIEHALRIIEHQGRAARDLARRAIGADIPLFDSDELLEARVSEVVIALSVEAERAGVKLSIEGDGKGVRIAGASDFEQVLTNLIMNAISFSPADKSVRIAIAVTERLVSIVVHDEGEGIREERAHAIFTGTSTRRGGAGIGLRHARALARAQGGDVTLLPRDEAMNERGSRLEISWPRLSMLPLPPVSSPRMRPLAGKCILIVEDDPHVTQLLEATLSARGAEVVLAKSAIDLSRLIHRRYDGALIDLSPILGHEAAALGALRATSPSARIVLITGSADGVPESIAAQSLRLVRKPFEVSEVVAALTDD